MWARETYSACDFSRSSRKNSGSSELISAAYLPALAASSVTARSPSKTPRDTYPGAGPGAALASLAAASTALRQASEHVPIVLTEHSGHWT
mmetsp:Transcript_14480/g.38790  ORF Transcript_14480/g.38790 Transcript_14480/m.38790 type:complete len:91 (+) Transcript_14480:858-1130(+)